MLLVLRRVHLPAFPSLPLQHLHTIVPASSSSPSGNIAPPVAVFWDLRNQPPDNAIQPYDAAVRLRIAAGSFGRLRIAAAYATPHTLAHIPRPSRADEIAKPLTCRVCGRNFYAHSKLLNHFKIHEREHAKRLNRVGSATGRRYVRLKAQLNFKMEKYSRAAREMQIPAAGRSLGDEIRRAGVLVRIVEDRLEAMTEGVMEAIGSPRVGCLILVSNDLGFCGVIREARMRCWKTVVVGDDGDGSLKRGADASFSWRDVVSGKARKEAGSALLKWKDKDLVKKLEWRYQPELGFGERDCEGGDWEEMDSGDVRVSRGFEDLRERRVSRPWWKLADGVQRSDLQLTVRD